MRRLISGGAASESGNFTWLRVTSYTPGATLSLDRQKPINVDALLAYESQANYGGPSWKTIELTGTIIVEVGEDIKDRFPGPVNEATSNEVALVTIAPVISFGNGSGGVQTFSNDVVIGGQQSDGTFNVYAAPLQGSSPAGTDGLFPIAAASNAATPLYVLPRADTSGRLKVVPRASDWTVVNEGVAGATATATKAAAGAGLRNITLGGTVGIVLGATAGVVFGRVRDGTTGAGTILWTCVVGGGANAQFDIDIPAGITGTANTAMTVEFSAAVALGTQSVALSGFVDNGP